jgi:hypothetical protein
MDAWCATNPNIGFIICCDEGLLIAAPNIPISRASLFGNLGQQSKRLGANRRMLHNTATVGNLLTVILSMQSGDQLVL